MNPKKNLYCMFCGEFPDRIIEVCREPIEEIRDWDGTTYALSDTNLDTVEFIQKCGKCLNKLILKK